MQLHSIAKALIWVSVIGINLFGSQLFCSVWVFAWVEFSVLLLLLLLQWYTVGIRDPHSALYLAEHDVVLPHINTINSVKQPVPAISIEAGLPSMVCPRRSMWPWALRANPGGW